MNRFPSEGPNRRRLLATVPALLATGLAGTLGTAAAQTELTDLARIKAGGALKVAVYKDNAPFSDGPANAVTGLDVSIAEAVAAKMGLRLSLLPFDAGENMNDDLRNMVWRGHYLGYGPADVMLQVPVDRYLMQRNRQVIVLAPYMRQQLVLAHDTRKIAEVQSADDLKGLPLAAERGAGAASALMGYGGGLLRTQVGIHATGQDAVKAVIEGKAAAAFVTRAQAESALFAAGTKPGNIRLSSLSLPGVPDTGWTVGMAIKAEHKELGLALEGALSQLRSSGELLAIFQKHGLTLTAP
ncbi:MAG: ABC transporter permease [Comamonadaceae bacterium]|nr:ABC transporter permease [Comamonadaceae bacterium]